MRLDGAGRSRRRGERALAEKVAERARRRMIRTSPWRPTPGGPDSYHAAMQPVRSTMSNQGLTRPRRGNLIAGVCAGLARRLGIPAIAVRALFVVSIFFPGPQFVVYLLLWVLMPREAESGPIYPPA